MEEEELGQMRTLGHHDVITCSRCGRPTDVHLAAVVPSDALESTSDYEHLCDSCQLALANGERDLPTQGL